MADVDEFLEHHGVRGMKWGVRRKRGNVKVSSDAKRKIQIVTKAKTHSINSLTNKELKDVNARLNMEQQFRNMQPKTAGQKGKEFLKSFFGVKNVNMKQVNEFSRGPVGKAIVGTLGVGAKHKKK